jgi:hypothetical protein
VLSLPTAALDLAFPGLPSQSPPSFSSRGCGFHPVFLNSVGICLFKKIPVPKVGFYDRAKSNAYAQLLVT